MTVKQRLLQYSSTESEIKQLKEQIATLKERATSIKSSSDIGDVPSGSGNTDKIGELVSKIVDMQNKYYEKTLALVEELLWIEQTINTLDDATERLLMRSRYIDNNTWEEVCMIIGYSWRQTHRLHRDILTKISS